MNVVLWSGPSLVTAFAGAGLTCFIAGCFSVSRRMDVKTRSSRGIQKHLIDCSRILLVVACAAVVSVVWTFLMVHLQISAAEIVSFIGGIGTTVFFLRRAGLFVAPVALRRE
jgi:hypothetical protein